MSKKRKSRNLAESKTEAEKPIAQPEAMLNQSRLSLLKRNWLVVLIMG